MDKNLFPGFSEANVSTHQRCTNSKVGQKAGNQESVQRLCINQSDFSNIPWGCALWHIASRCWNWTLNSKRVAERKKWKNWSVVSSGVGCSTFTLTNAWCHAFEQGVLKGNDSEEVGNLWMMSTVILLDTTVCHFSPLIFKGLYVHERGDVCNLKERSVLLSATFKGWILCSGISDTLFQPLLEESLRQSRQQFIDIMDHYHSLTLLT